MNRMTQISRMTKFYFLLIFIALALCSFCHSVKKHKAGRWLRKARKGHNSPPATKWIGGVARSDEVVKKTIHKNLRVSAPFRVKITCSFCSFCLKTQSREVVKPEKYTSCTNKVIVSLCIMH